MRYSFPDIRATARRDAAGFGSVACMTLLVNAFGMVLSGHNSPVWFCWFAGNFALSAVMVRRAVRSFTENVEDGREPHSD